MDSLCGKRLAPVLPGMLANLEAHEHLQVDEEVRQKLHRIGVASIDRLLNWGNDPRWGRFSMRQCAQRHIVFRDEDKEIYIEKLLGKVGT